VWRVFPVEENSAVSILRFLQFCCREVARMLTVAFSKKTSDVELMISPPFQIMPKDLNLSACFACQWVCLWIDDISQTRGQVLIPRQSTGNPQSGLILLNCEILCYMAIELFKIVGAFQITWHLFPDFVFQLKNKNSDNGWESWDGVGRRPRNQSLLSSRKADSILQGQVFWVHRPVWTTPGEPCNVSEARGGHGAP